MIEILNLINTIASDNSIWIAIIAINMTIIGLTSLAESKVVIGVDYGKFLISKYKVGTVIRIYYLLILFAIVNSGTLLLMFVNENGIRTGNFVVLLLSLVFAIFYFFSYILIENRFVKKQVYKKELLGMYRKSERKTTFEADRVVNISDGESTGKGISNNVIEYFNNQDSDIVGAFEEAFGPKSIIYTQKKITDYDYLYDSHKSIHHISHEFFQLFRYSELQDKWILEIIKLFNTDKVSIEFKQINILRCLAHVNTFGFCENLFKYKFLENIKKHLIESLCYNSKNGEVDSNIEKHLAKELMKYIYSNIINFNDSKFYETAENIITEIITCDLESKIINQRLLVLLSEYKNYKSQRVEEFIIDIINKYNDCEIDNKFSVDEIREILMKEENEKIKSKITRDDIFR